MKIFKAPLRAGLSYSLKASSLEAVLINDGVKTPTTFHQRTENWWTEGVLFRADFSPPGQYYLNEGEVLNVSCRSVSSGMRLEASAFLEAVVLPAFSAWIRGLECLPSNSPIRREKQAFAREWPPK